MLWRLLLAVDIHRDEASCEMDLIAAASREMRLLEIVMLPGWRVKGEIRDD